MLFKQRFLLIVQTLYVEDIINEQPLFVLNWEGNIPIGIMSLTVGMSETLYTFDVKPMIVLLLDMITIPVSHGQPRINDSVLMIKENGSSIIYTNFSP